MALTIEGNLCSLAIDCVPSHPPPTAELHFLQWGRKEVICAVVPGRRGRGPLDIVLLLSCITTQELLSPQPLGKWRDSSASEPRAAGGAAAAAPLFPGARRSGRQRRGPWGAGARGAHERVGAAASGDLGQRLAPPRSPAVIGGCAGPCPRVGGGGGGCPAPTRRPHVWRGPSFVPSLTGRQKRCSRGAALSRLRGALWGPSLPAWAPHAPATRPTPTGGNRDPERCWVLRRRRSESFISQKGWSLKTGCWLKSWEG